jgi:hypothetical protein
MKKISSFFLKKLNKNEKKEARLRLRFRLRRKNRGVP